MTWVPISSPLSQVVFSSFSFLGFLLKGGKWLRGRSDSKARGRAPALSVGVLMNCSWWGSMLENRAVWSTMSRLECTLIGPLPGRCPRLSCLCGRLVDFLKFLGLWVVRRGRLRNWFRAGWTGVLDGAEVAWPGRRVGPDGSGGSCVGPEGSGSSSS